MKKYITFGTDRPLAQIVSRAWVLAQRERKQVQRRTPEGRAARRREAANRRERHPEVVAHYKATRDARERGATGSHTLAEWNALVAEHDGACAYCGRKDAPLTRDHRIPIARGGTHGIDNILPACRSCNSRKGARI